jgi:hypothetical protein
VRASNLTFDSASLHHEVSDITDLTHCSVAPFGADHFARFDGLCCGLAGFFVSEILMSHRCILTIWGNRAWLTLN